jgi:hypothetical protein
VATDGPQQIVILRSADFPSDPRPTGTHAASHTLSIGDLASFARPVRSVQQHHHPRQASASAARFSAQGLQRCSLDDVHLVCALCARRLVFARLQVVFAACDPAAGARLCRSETATADEKFCRDPRGRAESRAGEVGRGGVYEVVGGRAGACRGRAGPRLRGRSRWRRRWWWWPRSRERQGQGRRQPFRRPEEGTARKQGQGPWRRGRWWTVSATSARRAVCGPRIHSSRRSGIQGTQTAQARWAGKEAAGRRPKDRRCRAEPRLDRRPLMIHRTQRIELNPTRPYDMLYGMLHCLLPLPVSILAIFSGRAESPLSYTVRLASVNRYTR